MLFRSRFVPYSDNGGTLHLGWTLVMAALALVVVAASVYLVWVLEILKLRRIRERGLRRSNPAISDDAIDRDVAERIETGQFDAIRAEDV